MNSIGFGFGLSILLTFIVGYLASRKKENNSEDYLLAGRSVSAIPIAFSLFSTTLSGFMFLGYIGYVSQVGLTAIWFPICWMIGNYVTWAYMHHKVRALSIESNALTYTKLAIPESKSRFNLVLKLAALIIIGFLVIYAASQLQIGAKSLNTLFGLTLNQGLILGAIITLGYCYAGGLRASIWTDVLQTIIMITAMISLCLACVNHLGGLTNLFNALNLSHPELLNPFTHSFKFGLALFALSVFVNAIGILGQPHIMQRALAAASDKDLHQARNIYLVCYFVFTCAAILVGLSAKVILAGKLVDTEMAVPMLAELLLPKILVGFLLAGIFSATLSTMDSQVISCSACVSEDLLDLKNPKSKYKISKIATVVTIIFTLLVAMQSNKGIFETTLIAWSALAAIFTPLIVLKCFNYKVHSLTALLMLVSSLATVIYWRFFTDYSSSVYEALPGMLVAFTVCILDSLIRRSAIFSKVAVKLR
jgi:sodium/proline symporter